jgi:rRNA biogenesis protein RRP5
MRIMGAVKEIHELNLIISLPNNLTGYVSIAEISEKLSMILLGRAYPMMRTKK